MTNAIFTNVRSVNDEADRNPNTLRISVDTKAVVHVGEYSRKGKSRCRKAVSALDHDMMPKQKLVPVGVLEPISGRSFIAFGSNNKTSDLIVDSLKAWWVERHCDLTNIRRLVLNIDNGPECNSRRSQFMARIAQFSDETGLEIRLVYYPPYHSKYNSIEHFWGGLERSWNGYLLDSVDGVLRRTQNFSWRKMRPVVTVLTREYAKGIKPCRRDKKAIDARLARSSQLPWWDVSITPKAVS